MTKISKIIKLSLAKMPLLLTLIVFTILLQISYGQQVPKRTTIKPALIPAAGKCYHISTLTGNDNNMGVSFNTAFKTIQKGADVAMPGDTVLVYGGIYRERVKPPRGGTSADKQIVYMAKPKEHVVITALDSWEPVWNWEGSIYFAAPSNAMFSDTNYVDGGNPFKIAYMGTDSLSLGQVVVDGIEYEEQKSKASITTKPRSWWADKTTGTIYINFGGDPLNKKVEIVTRRGVFRPYLKGLGYITVQGFDLAYCGNNAASPVVFGSLHPHFQSGLIGTRQGHHWRIIGNKIRNAKGLGLSVSIGTDMADENWWDPHGLLMGKTQVEVNYPTVSSGDNESEPENSQLKSMPYKEVGFNLIANNDFESCGMNGIAGIGSVGNTIYGNRFSNCAYLIDENSAEDAAIKMHMQYGTLIEQNLFENSPGDHRAIWIDNNNPATRIRRNVFLRHTGNTPTVFFEITSSLNQYVSVVDNNLFINCSHGVVSAAADGVAFYHNLFYKCGEGFSMGSKREQAGADYGNMRIHNWNNLFVDQERAFGFAFNQSTNFHTSDFNLMYKPTGMAFCKYLLSDSGTARGPGGRPGVTIYNRSDIIAAKAGGSYWKDSTNWGANNSPDGCEADIGYWRGTMGKSVDRHSEERPSANASFTNRRITLQLASNPLIKDAPIMKGAAIDFYGKAISSSVKAGPFQNAGATKQTFTFWDDKKMPGLPALPKAPTNMKVTIKSATTIELNWKNNSLDASFIYVERKVNGGPWKFWGYITTTQENMLDFDLNVKSDKYEYRIAARNAAGLSQFTYAGK
jgi:hypothetical protein